MRDVLMRIGRIRKNRPKNHTSGKNCLYSNYKALLLHVMHFDIFLGKKSIIGPDFTFTTSLNGPWVYKNTALGALFSNLKCQTQKVFTVVDQFFLK